MGQKKLIALTCRNKYFMFSFVIYNIFKKLDSISFYKLCISQLLALKKPARSLYVNPLFNRQINIKNF